MVKCEEALRTRKKKSAKIWTLPDCLPSTSTYYLDCYQRFTALDKAHRKNMQEMTKALSSQPENKITRTSSNLDKTNRVGIFPKTNIFCGNIRKTFGKK